MTEQATPTIERGASVDEAGDYLDSLDLFGLNPREETDESPQSQATDETLDDDELSKDNDGDDSVPDEDEDSPEEDETTEDQALTLETIAERLGVNVEDLYNVQLTTKIDGSEGMATLKELQKSYQLAGHVNKKSMEVSTLQKELEATRAQQEQEVIAQKKQAIDLVRSHLMGEYTRIDWDTLKQDDPDRYAQKWIEFQQKEKEFNRQIEDYNQRLNQYQTEQQQQLQALIQEQAQKVYDFAPEWADETVKQREQKQIRSYLQEYGFTEAEMGIYDARHVAILRDAARYKALQKQKPSVSKRVAEAPRTVKSGTKQAPTGKSADKVNAFMKSRDLNSAASLLADYL
jgi:hypothetical protein